MADEPSTMASVSLHDDDHMMVSRGGQSFKISGAEVKSGLTGAGGNLKDTDTFLVNRASQSFSVQAKDLVTRVKDDDLMMVSRGGQVFRATGEQITNSLGPPPTPEQAALQGLTTLYTGDGESEQVLVNGMDLKNDVSLVWAKYRSTAGNHFFTDTKRGPGKVIYTDTTLDPEQDVNVIAGFNENGFTIGSQYNDVDVEAVAWSFSKSSGWFTAVEYVGTGENHDVDHDLGKKPGMIIVKNLDADGHWYVKHQAVTSGTTLLLDWNGSFLDGGSVDNWQQKEADENKFYLGPAVGSDLIPIGTNLAGDRYIAYLFAEDVANTIKCGKYVGNGGTQTIDVGFKPQWFMTKGWDNSGFWTMVDSKRGTDETRFLYAQNPTKEDTIEDPWVQFADTGIQLLNGWAGINGGTPDSGGATYVYMAIAEPP